MQEELIALFLGMLTIFSLGGAWFSRMCGGAQPNFPSILNEVLYAVPHTALFVASCGLWSIPVFFNVFLFKRTGHGRGMSLKEAMKKGTKPEKVEYLILWLQPFLPTYWYKFLLMSVLGLLLSLIPGIIWATHVSVFWGSLYAVSGLLAGPAYAIGWWIYPSKKTNNPNTQLGSGTEVGEFVTGLFDYFFLLLMYLASLDAAKNIFN